MGVKGLPGVRQLVTKQPRMLEKEPSVSGCLSVWLAGWLAVSLSCVSLSAPGSELFPILSRLRYQFTFFESLSLFSIHSVIS